MEPAGGAKSAGGAAKDGEHHERRPSQTRHPSPKAFEEARKDDDGGAAEYRGIKSDEMKNAFAKEMRVAGSRAVRKREVFRLHGVFESLRLQPKQAGLRPDTNLTASSVSAALCDSFDQMLAMYFPQATKGDIKEMIQIITDRDAVKARKKREWTPEERQIVYDLFQAWDKDGSGSIELHEFRQALAGTGLGDLELKGLFQSIDVDGSGEIGLHEFADFVQNEMNLFERFDGIVKREKRRRDEANTLTG